MEEIIKMLREVKYKVEEMDDPTGPEKLRSDLLWAHTYIEECIEKVKGI